MEPLTSFRFTELPAELRLKIYGFAHFPRVLQLGINNGLPFPYLPDSPAYKNVRNQAFSPITTTLPPLFHVWHESRAVCLATYVPFAYTYVHPTLDTLYISKQAGASLFENVAGLGARAMPPLYPIALLNRVALEFDFKDLPQNAQKEHGSVRNASGTMHMSNVMDYYVQLFAKFGPPKEILIVRGAAGVYSQHSMSISGWKSIQIIDGIQNIDLPRWAENRLIEYTEDFFAIYRATNPWLQWRMPEFRIVGIKQKGEIVLWKKLNANAARKSRTLAKEWREKTVLRDPYNLENTTRALDEAGIVSNACRSMADLMRVG